VFKRACVVILILSSAGGNEPTDSSAITRHLARRTDGPCWSIVRLVSGQLMRGRLGS